MTKPILPSFSQQVSLLSAFLEKNGHRSSTTEQSINEVTARLRGYPDYATYVTVESGSEPGKTVPKDFAQKVNFDWYAEDVQSVRPDLSEKEVSFILFSMDAEHANDAITWEDIEVKADELFKRRSFAAKLHGRAPLIATISGKVTFDKYFKIKFVPDNRKLAKSLLPDLKYSCPDNCRVSFIGNTADDGSSEDIIFAVEAGALAFDKDKQYCPSMELRDYIYSMVASLERKGALLPVSSHVILENEQLTKISATWSVQDVCQFRPDLTFYEAYLVLAYADRKFDGHQGIEEDVLRDKSYDLFDTREFPAQVRMSDTADESTYTDSTVTFDDDVSFDFSGDICARVGQDPKISQCQVRLKGTEDMPAGGWFTVSKDEMIVAREYSLGPDSTNMQNNRHFLRLAIAQLSLKGLLQNVGTR